MNRRQMLVTDVIGGGAPADTTAPTCVVTANAATITAAAFTATFTFSEPVIGFDASKITVANGSAGAVAGTGPYTSVITPTATGTVTVQVEANKVTDAALNNNEASNTFSILYINAKVWVDFSDITTLYQTNDTSTPITADGQSIGYAADKSGTGNHVLQATAGSRPTYKTNIQNGLSAALGDGGDWLRASFTNLAQPNTIFLVIKNPAAGTENIFDGGGGGREVLYHTATNIRWFAGSDRDTGVAVTTTTHSMAILFSGASSVLRRNGAQIDAFNVGTNALGGITLMSSSSGSSGLAGYMMEIIVCNADLSTPVMQAIEAYLATKWGF
jgi:hypothetical protein